MINKPPSQAIGPKVSNVYKAGFSDDIGTRFERPVHLALPVLVALNHALSLGTLPNPSARGYRSRLSKRRQSTRRGAAGFCNGGFLP